ncbi:MAG: Asp-tRNA(Asn)/Glu-tRNA(Gln) amidotransferase subunit GatC [Rhodospirillaceae bacterium]|nr:Asp-tRNA(Asn)/Glu-tRNA(Gln) amidotransferase subunit GatC [Rhodospirillaceae bacterium]MCY4239909.1 Asp-tRNA(Asn)/Glu-tRNA(Gln) amidotransferase subunit GatC [Rhodospirillaceae bacterium]MCY4310729.1 Asp-tRNA(Asn)/Glu-tRNA(Gln) amidotransferase subunit GatC [Rhodospirillaceae bacterium]
MALDTDAVRQIAHLARVRVPEADLEVLAGELSNILTWVEQLNDVATEDVPAMTSAVAVSLPMREDKVNEGDHEDAILANAPDRVRDFFAVPKVVD